MSWSLVFTVSVGRRVDRVIFRPGGQDFNDSLAILIRALDADLRHVRYHTEILRRATQWERQDFEKARLLRGTDLKKAQRWMSASALGKEPRLTTLHLSYITASQSIHSQTRKRKLIAVFFAFIVIIGELECLWPFDLEE